MYQLHFKAGANRRGSGHAMDEVSNRVFEWLRQRHRYSPQTRPEFSHSVRSEEFRQNGFSDAVDELEVLPRLHTSRRSKIA